METAARDRSAMIMVLGVIQLVLGGITALFAILGVVSVLGMTLRMAGAHGPSTASMAAPILFYILPAANLTATGIGSVRYLPWARMATIVSSIVWLVLGILFVVGFAVAVFEMGSRIGGAEAIVMIAILGPFFLGLPVTLLALYTRPGVRETFARRHAERR